MSLRGVGSLSLDGVYCLLYLDYVISCSLPWVASCYTTRGFFLPPFDQIGFLNASHQCVVVHIVFFFFFLFLSGLVLPHHRLPFFDKINLLNVSSLYSWCLNLSFYCWCLCLLWFLLNFWWVFSCDGLGISTPSPPLYYNYILVNVIWLSIKKNFG